MPSLLLVLRNFIGDVGRALWPALMPSWRFFDEIGPSPRIDFVWQLPANASPATVDWKEFRPPAKKLNLAHAIGHLFWNPIRNENLFLISNAELLLLEESVPASRQIFRLIAKAEPAPSPECRLSFRVRLLPQDEVVYVSEPRTPSEMGMPI